MKSPVKSPKKSPAKLLARSPSKSPIKLMAKLTAKSPASSPTKSLGKSPAKSTNKTSAKRLAKSPAKTPVKFVKPAELFKMRQARKCDNRYDMTSQSPLKCLKDPSPTKNVHNLLSNPLFRRKSVRRPLSFDSSNSPKKRPRSNSSSPKKRFKMNMEMDEDANMEAPYFNSNGASNCDSDEEDFEDEENDEDASQFLESLGMTVSQQDFPSLGKFK